MKLRWKKDPLPTGLARIGCGPQGSALRINGDVIVATISCHNKNPNEWYWVAGWSAETVPYKNTCNDMPQTEQDAKKSAMEYVKLYLKDGE